MDKRILVVGSILAVVILIGVSFTSVVGYSNNRSNSLSVSPLYNIRTNRAIENGEDVTTCDYVGKDKEITVPFPEKTIILEVIKKLRQMDKNEIKELNDYLRKNIMVNDLLRNQNEFKYIKNHQKEIAQFDLANKDITEEMECFTLGPDESFLTCFFVYFILLLVVLPAIIIEGLFSIFKIITLLLGCISPSGMESFCYTYTNCCECD